MGKRKIRTGEHPYSKYKKGFTLPGYNYLGPFNGENNGKATGHSDKAAQDHDNEYKDSIKNHGYIKTYLRHNTADERFTKSIQNDKDWGAKIARRVFNNKRKANEEFGFHTPLQLTQHGEPTMHPNKMPRLSLRNNLSSTTMSGDSNMDGTGSGKNQPGTLSETPVDDVWDVHRGPPDYTFASLPFMQMERNNAQFSTWDHTFRMTCPLDVRITNLSADINIGAGVNTVVYATTDATDTNLTGDSARWWNLYAGMYDFYHVVGARWTATFENLSGEMMYVHQMYHNDEVQPYTASNEDMLCWGDIKSHLLGPHYVAITTNGEVESNENTNAIQTEAVSLGTSPNFETSNHVTRKGGPSPIQTFSGQYSPGQYKRAIHLDDVVENWSQVTANPKLTERLTFRIKPYSNSVSLNSASSSSRQLNYRYQLKIEYLCEFKQLKTGLRYPVQRQPLTVVIAQDGASLS